MSPQRASAEYTLFASWPGGPQSSGEPPLPIVAPPGALVTIQMVLDGTNAFDFHNSALLRMECSAPGLVFESMSWQAPYVTDTIFNLSTPAVEALPVVLAPDLIGGPAYPLGAVDIELANVTDPFAGLPPPFTEGVLVELGLRIPEPWLGPTVLTFRAIPDTFAYGSLLKPAVEGNNQALFIADPDFDSNGTVDGGDLGLLLSAWGACPPDSGDVNGDGIVDSGDLGLVLAGFGTSGPVGDLDSSGFVDGADLGVVLSGLGTIVTPCPDLNGDDVVNGADLGLLLTIWD